MQCLHLRLRPGSAFGGPIKGDTLFGQLCWAARNRWGESRLAELLDEYTHGRPFAVCSDAFPLGHLPRPALPVHGYAPLAELDRKAVKRRRWVPLSALDLPVADWLGHCRSDSEVAADLGAKAGHLTEVHAQHHNTIHRLTGTTGSAEFAPYTQEQHWFAAGIDLHLYLLVDPTCLAANDAALLMGDIGRVGYGRDASIGLGKFDLVGEPQTGPLPNQTTANACFTLAPCAPQGLGFSASASHYELFTRFGRHGDLAVHTGRPFKAPVLLAQTGAVLARCGLPADPFLGQGLGGDGSLSKAPGLAATVQQGYAPWIGLHIEEAS